MSAKQRTSGLIDRRIAGENLTGFEGWLVRLSRNTFQGTLYNIYFSFSASFVPGIGAANVGSIAIYRIWDCLDGQHILLLVLCCPTLLGECPPLSPAPDSCWLNITVHHSDI